MFEPLWLTNIRRSRESGGGGGGGGGNAGGFRSGLRVVVLQYHSHVKSGDADHITDELARGCRADGA